MIAAVRKYIRKYEHLEKTALLNVEYLPSKPINYSLMEEPSITLSQFLNGDKLVEYRIRLMRITSYEEPVAINVENSKFMQDFSKWISDNNKNKVLPNINGIQSMNIITPGTLTAVADDGTSAVYTVVLGFRIIE